MYYIAKIPTGNGNYGSPNSVASGYALPDELLNAYLQTKGFALLKIENDIVTEVKVNEQALSDYLAECSKYELTSIEKRRNIYNNEKLITWNNENLTITEAAQLWQYYAAEGNTEKTALLTMLIAEAKTKVRNELQDESGE